jgi:hypothetical protein
MPNTWLFITKEPTNIALTCNGIREDILLKNAGIIQIGQNCILKTKQNTLTAKRTNTVPVKASYSKATINLNLNTTLLNHPDQIEEEPVFKISDDIGELKYDEEKIQKHLEETLWKKVKKHSLTVNGSTTVTMVAALFTLQAILIYWYKRHQRQKKSKVASKEKMIELQPLKTEQPLDEPDPLETRENV